MTAPAIAARSESRSRIASALAARPSIPVDARLLLSGLAIWGAILAGMFLKSDPLMLVGSLAALVGGLVSPGLGLVVVAFMGPLKPPPVIPAPGFNLALVACILLGCVYRLPFERPSLRPALPLLLLLALFVYIFAQQTPEMLSGYADERAHDVGYLFFQLSAGMGTIVAAGYVLRGRSPYPVLAALLLSATFAAVLAVVTAGDLPLSGLANLMPRPDVGSRASGPFGNPNVFGQLLAYACTLAIGLLTARRSRPIRVGLVAVLLIMLYALTLSLSRGAVAALLAGIITLAFVRSRRLGIAMLVSAAVVVLVGYPMFVEWRLATEAGAASADAAAQLASSDGSRLSAVLAGPALLALAPVFGIGFGQYRFMSALVSDEGGGLVAHNWYGTVLAEQGLTGLVLWVLVLVTVGLWLRSRPVYPRAIGAAVLIAMMVGCLFLSVPLNFQIAVLPIIAVTAALVADWSPERPRPTPVEVQGPPGAGDTSRGPARRRGEAGGRLGGA